MSFTLGPWQEVCDGGSWWIQSNYDDGAQIVIPDTEGMLQADIDLICTVPEMYREIKDIEGILAKAGIVDEGLTVGTRVELLRHQMDKARQKAADLQSQLETAYRTILQLENELEQAEVYNDDD